MKTCFIIIAYYPKRTISGLRRALTGYPVVEVDNTLANIGYGEGANKGIRDVLKHGVGWVVILNQDLRITRGAVKKFVEILKVTSIGIAGPIIGGLDLRRWTTILPAKRKKEKYISGSCFAIHREVIKSIGNFDKKYFMYYEDVDLCMRAAAAGFVLTCLPILGITHVETASLGSGSFLHQYYLARNHLLFVERNAPARVKLYEALRLPKTIWEHLRKKEWGALAGIRDYFFRRFGQYKPLW